MSEVPPPMPEIPKIPRGPLWICLLLPPLMLVIFIAYFLFTAYNLEKASSVFHWLPGQALGLLSIAVYIVCLIRFILIMNRRYATSTVVLLAFGYVIGQGVIAFSLYFGACVLMLSHA